MNHYIPANGTEIMSFEAHWCDRCARNPKSPDAKNQCKYLVKALLGEKNGVWYLDENEVPQCGAFSLRSAGRKQKEDVNQQKLFA